MRDLRFSLGLFLIVLSIPFFSFSGDLRLECILNDTGSCDVYKNIQIGSLATMTIGMLLAILSRPGGTGIKAIDDFDEGKVFDTFDDAFNDEPPSDARGVMKEGTSGWNILPDQRHGTHDPRQAGLGQNTTPDDTLQ